MKNDINLRITTRLALANTRDFSLWCRSAGKHDDLPSRNTPRSSPRKASAGLCSRGLGKIVATTACSTRALHFFPRVPSPARISLAPLRPLKPARHFCRISAARFINMERAGRIAENKSAFGKSFIEAHLSGIWERGGRDAAARARLWPARCWYDESVRVVCTGAKWKGDPRARCVVYIRLTSLCPSNGRRPCNSYESLPGANRGVRL